MILKSDLGHLPELVVTSWASLIFVIVMPNNFLKPFRNCVFDNWSNFSKFTFNFQIWAGSYNYLKDSFFSASLKIRSHLEMKILVRNDARQKQIINHKLRRKKIDSCLYWIFEIIFLFFIWKRDSWNNEDVSPLSHVVH